MNALNGVTSDASILQKKQERILSELVFLVTKITKIIPFMYQKKL